MELGSAVTDPMGGVSLAVPSPFFGYVRVVGEPVYPFLLYRFPPAAASTQDAAGVPTAAQVERGLTPGRGHISMNVFDCNGALASGVSVSVSTADDQTRTLYTGTDEIPVPGTETTARGGVAIVDVPPGFVTVTATIGRICKQSSRVNIAVMPDTFTYAPLPPSP
jgi:hypothetical protein